MFNAPLRYCDDEKLGLPRACDSLRYPRRPHRLSESLDLFRAGVRTRLEEEQFFTFIGSLAFADAVIGVTYFDFMVLNYIGVFSPSLLANFNTIGCYFSIVPMVFGTVLQESITAAA